jgi:hypothetical protein
MILERVLRMDQAKLRTEIITLLMVMEDQRLQMLIKVVGQTLNIILSLRL